MKKVFLLATAGLMFAGVALAHEGEKGKKKKCAKGKTCCSKEAKAKAACCKDKAEKTAKM
jgi:hypothetical protein